MKENKVVKIIEVILVVVLLLALVGGVTFGALRLKDVIEKNNAEATSEDNENELLPPADDIFLVNPISNANVKLLALKSSDDDSVVSLRATITPTITRDKQADWAIAWVNPHSEWASGKTVTDYVTVTPRADGSVIADIRNLQAFGEQIIVTVYVRNNHELSATCTVDYRAHYYIADNQKPIISPGQLSIRVAETVGTIHSDDETLNIAILPNVSNKVLKAYNDMPELTTVAQNVHALKKYNLYQRKMSVPIHSGVVSVQSPFFTYDNVFLNNFDYFKGVYPDVGQFDFDEARGHFAAQFYEPFQESTDKETYTNAGVATFLYDNFYECIRSFLDACIAEARAATDGYYMYTLLIYTDSLDINLQIDMEGFEGSGQSSAADRWISYIQGVADSILDEASDIELSDRSIIF